MNAQDIACQQAFAAGDLKYYQGAQCAQSAQNTALVSAAKKSVNTKTIILIAVGVVATGSLIYFATRK